MIFFRWLFVLILISPILFFNRAKIYNSIKNNFKILFILAILGITGFNTLLYIGLTTTTATNALIINSSIPMIILFLSYVILKQETNRKQLLGIVISTFGVLFLILKGDINNILSLKFNAGDFWILASSFAWAIYSIYVKYRPKELNDFEFFSTIVLIGFIFLLPIYLYQGYKIEHEIYLVQTYYLEFLYVSIFASLLSYYFWNKGVKEIGANKTGQFTHLMPVFGSILAYIFLGETLMFYHIIGMILIGVGIYLSLFSNDRKNKS